MAAPGWGWGFALGMSLWSRTGWVIYRRVSGTSSNSLTYRRADAYVQVRQYGLRLCLPAPPSRPKTAKSRVIRHRLPVVKECHRPPQGPPGPRLNAIFQLRFVIPKLHIHGHTLNCQRTFSLNYLPGAGRTDSEGVEQPWASVGLVATSTREMGPGSRHDCLDDHWGYWNWQKLVGLGAFFFWMLHLFIGS